MHSSVKKGLFCNVGISMNAQRFQARLERHFNLAIEIAISGVLQRKVDIGWERMP